jgi:hypothetical protein
MRRSVTIELVGATPAEAEQFAKQARAGAALLGVTVRVRVEGSTVWLTGVPASIDALLQAEAPAERTKSVDALANTDTHDAPPAAITLDPYESEQSFRRSPRGRR